MKNQKTHNGKIEFLNDSQVFCFGSNLSGFHGAGSAGFASFGEYGNVWRKYDYANKPKGWKGKWNIKGIGEGFQEGICGKSYAIPTVARAGVKRSIPLEKIKESVVYFYDFARNNIHLEFLVAYSVNNNNLNGYSTEEMASVFRGDIPENVVFEKEFLNKIVKSD